MRPELRFVQVRLFADGKQSSEEDLMEDAL